MQLSLQCIFHYKVQLSLQSAIVITKCICHYKVQLSLQSVFSIHIVGAMNECQFFLDHYQYKLPVDCDTFPDSNDPSVCLQTPPLPKHPSQGRLGLGDDTYILLQ